MLGSDYIWQVNAAEEIETADLNVHPAILQLLKQRGIESGECIRRFMNPHLGYLYNPMLIKDMDKAVDRIKKALVGNEKITVYGDYDVDGITSCCLLVKLLRKMGGSVDYYIPSRLEEGYGLNIDAVKKISDNGSKLIITVDNGISSFEETELAVSLGMDVVITDHHEPRDILPQAAAVVDPKRKDCSYPFKNLAGVGVALKLAHALTDLDNETLYEYLDIAVLGTVADVVPLLDENRIIVKNGLKLLANTKNKGLKAMMSLLNLNGDTANFNTGKISYILAPRLNAVGRIGNADLALELLLTEDENQAYEMVKQLESTNLERQSIESKILNEAKKKLSKDIDSTGVIVLSAKDWHPGVLGIVASKISEEYHRPCILISLEGDEGRGSGRSIQGFNLFEALNRLSHLLIKFGGHEQAVGLTIRTDHIEVFRQKINEIASLTDGDFNQTLEIDLELKEEDIDLGLAEQLELLEPFGYGNPKPVFICKDLLPCNVRTVGNGDKHLKFYLKNGEKSFDAIGFNLGFYKDDLCLAPTVDVAFNLEVNRWRGIDEPQFKIKDIKAPYLRDELLSTIENGYLRRYFYNSPEKVFETIFDDVGYQSELKVSEQNIYFYNRQSDIQKMQFVKSSFEEDRRVLVVINTPYQAWRLLAYLRPMTQLKEHTEAYFNLDLSQIPNQKNIILINPIFQTFPSHFESIIIYDTPFSISILNKQIRAVPTKSNLMLIFDAEDLRDNFMVYKKIMPGIDEIKVLYGLLHKIKDGKPVGSVNLEEIHNSVCNLIGEDVHLMSIINAFRVFQELGIIRLNIDNGLLYITDYKKPEKKLKIESSDTYMNFIKARQSLDEFKDKYDYTKNIIIKSGRKK
jgi:single-stranded-DNA-specific exonuclease